MSANDHVYSRFGSIYIGSTVTGAAGAGFVLNGDNYDIGGKGLININNLDAVDITANTLTTNTGDFEKITVTTNSTDSGAITLNSTAGGTVSDLQFEAGGFPQLNVGINPTSGDSYISAQEDITISTDNIVRLTIPAAGVVQDDTVNNVLVLDGGVLKYRAATSISDGNPFDQDLNTTDQPSFAKLSVVPNGAVSGSAGIELTSDDNTKVGYVDFNYGATDYYGRLSYEHSTNRFYLFTDQVERVTLDGNYLKSNVPLRVSNISDAAGGAAVNVNGSLALAANNTATVTNKTINTGSNTIVSAAAGNVNLDSLINQDVRTTAAPTFRTSVNVTQAGNGGFTITGEGDFTYSASAGSYFTNAAAGDVNLRQQDNTKSLNIGVGSGTSQLEIDNNFVIANKPIMVANIYSPANVFNIYANVYNLFTVSDRTTGTVPFTILDFKTGVGHTYVVKLKVVGYIVSGTDVGSSGYFQYSYRFVNNGTLTNMGTFESLKSASSGYGANPVASAVGVRIQVTLAGSGVSSVYSWGGMVEVFVTQ